MLLLLRGAPPVLLVIALAVVGVVLLSLWKPLHAVHFQRTIVFMQARVDRYVPTLMCPYRFRILNAVSLLVFIVLHHVVVAIFANPSGDIRLSDPVAGLSLLIMSILALVLGHGADRANHHKSQCCENSILHVSSD